MYLLLESIYINQICAIIQIKSSCPVYSIDNLQKSKKHTHVFKKYSYIAKKKKKIVCLGHSHPIKNLY